MPRLCLSFLGPIQVILDDKPLSSSLLAKHLALLTYLAVEADRPHHRETLAGMFWPEQPETAARHSLRQAFHQLRISLGDLYPNFLIVTSQTAQFVPAEDYFLDIAAFTSCIERCNMHKHIHTETCVSCISRLQSAASLYRGEFLEDFFLKDSCGFEEWALVKRDDLARMAISAYHYLAEHYKLSGEYTSMEQAARRQIEINPFDERAHRRVMQALALRGENTAAIAHYESFRQMLARELDASPETQTNILQTKIRNGALTPQNPALLYNWHEPLTSFVGRKKDISQISQYLQDPEVRLVTIVGPGGIGKTRLALEVASQEAYSFRNGACFASLASVLQPENIAPVIVNSLGFSLNGPNEPFVQLKSHLRQKEMILILDNLEQITSARNYILDILQNCPSIKIIVTSHESLNLPQEWLIPLQGLEVPDKKSLASLEEYDAVRLFLHRACQIRPDFVVRDSDRLAVAQICRSVAGMPLALELAAAWVGVLSCQEIAQEIENHKEIISRDEPGRPDRHHSLQAALDYTWHLLNPLQQKALKCISVFKGGFTREAAEQVAGVDLAVLSALVNKSLLKYPSNNRYELHPLIGQYASERLAEMPYDKQSVEHKHGCFYTEFAGRYGELLKGPNQTEALQLFDLEIENVRKAWQWSINGVHLNQIERCRDGLGIYYRTKGCYQEGEKAFEQAINAIRRRLNEKPNTNTGMSTILGSVLVGQGICSLHLGQLFQAYQHIYEGLGLLRSSDSPMELAYALTWLGVATIYSGQYEQAITLTQEGLFYARSSCDPWTIGVSLLSLGHATRPINFIEAGNHYIESAKYFRDIGDQRTLATALYFYGEMIRQSGDLDEAKFQLEESLKLAKQTGSSSLEARCMGSLAEIAYSTGKYFEAQQLLKSSIDILNSIGEQRLILSGLACLGAVMYRLGKPLISDGYFQEAIKKGSEMLATPLLLGCLIHMAEPLINDNITKQRLAIDILLFVSQHPAAWQEDRVLAEKLLNKLKHDMPIGEYELSVHRDTKATIASLAEKVSSLLSQGTQRKVGDALV